MSLHWGAMAILSVASVILLLVCGVALWRTTRFQ
jgi:phosphate starvation-inducible membrane PsiE